MVVIYACLLKICNFAQIKQKDNEKVFTDFASGIACLCRLS